MRKEFEQALSVHTYSIAKRLPSIIDPPNTLRVHDLLQTAVLDDINKS